MKTQPQINDLSVRPSLHPPQTQLRSLIKRNFAELNSTPLNDMVGHRSTLRKNMKKLMFVAGLAGCLVTAAFAQNPIVTSPINVVVNNFVSVTALSGPAFTFIVNDG